MSEPTNTNYPISFDDGNSLLGALLDRKVYRLQVAIGVDDIEFPVDKDLSDLNLPCYITFQGGEIAYIESIGGAGNMTFIANSLDDRAKLGTSLQPHGKYEKIFVGIVSPYLKLLKLAIKATQKYQGRVGLDANKPATCLPGECYVATNTRKEYICFVENNWTWVNIVRHGDTDGLEDDDHAAIYQNDARADTWHDGQAGNHIAGGDDHDHFSADEGAAVLRIAGGLEENRPATPSKDALVYYSIDKDGGTLFVSVPFGEIYKWERISGVPSGGILPFPGACPSGFVRYDALNDRIPMGSDVAGDTGGVTTHDHAYTTIRQHYHVVAESNNTSTLNGEHDHTVKYGSNTGTGDKILLATVGGQARDTGYNGAHSHACAVSQHYTINAGGAECATETASSIPASRERVWCKKL